MRAADIAGERFHRLTAIRRDGTYSGGKARWLCRCDCGNYSHAAVHSLRSGNTKSCGCFKAENGVTQGMARRRHGMTKTRVWIAWDSMLQRCRNSNHKSFKDYGGRGIRVCERWNVFENFYTDMGEPPAGMTLERNDVNGDYTPSNCRWATMTEQGRNKRVNRIITSGGESKPLSAWVESTGLSKATITGRLAMGWSEHDAVTRPVRTRMAAVTRRGQPA